MVKAKAIKKQTASDGNNGRLSGADMVALPGDVSGVVGITASLVSAYVGNNHVDAAELPDLIRRVHGTLIAIETGRRPLTARTVKPAVSEKQSITPDYLICLEDGKRFKSLKRHLRTQYGLTPEAYREKWGLSANYPMVAPNYAATRSRLAKKIHLGHRTPIRPVAKQQKSARA